ncbi:MAG: 6-bladed beta-propeller [Gracilimonas sp.]|nr:6-bladed beta-propeller [Gracilimonas sp.]
MVITKHQLSLSLILKIKYQISVINDFEFGLIDDLEISADQKIYVNDLFLGILVFNQDGELLKEYNSKGQGPGDFASIDDLLVVNGQLFAVDPVLFEYLCLIRQSLTYQNSYDLPPINNNYGEVLSPSRLWRLDDGNFIIEYKGKYNRNNIDQDHYRQYVLTDSLFNSLDESLFRSKDREMLTYSEGNDFLVSMHPFGREDLVDVTPDGVVYKISTEQNCIEYFRSDRVEDTKEKCIEELTEKSISESDRTKMNTSEDADLYRKVSMPDSYPYAEELLLNSDGSNTTLWVTKRNSAGVTEVIEIAPETGRCTSEDQGRLFF